MLKQQFLLYLGAYAQVMIFSLSVLSHFALSALMLVTLTEMKGLQDLRDKALFSGINAVCMACKSFQKPISST